MLQRFRVIPNHVERDDGLANKLGGSVSHGENSQNREASDGPELTRHPKVHDASEKATKTEEHHACVETDERVPEVHPSHEKLAGDHLPVPVGMIRKAV